MPCGKVTGGTDGKGYDVKDGIVRPSDLAAAVFRHRLPPPSSATVFRRLGIDLNSQWVNGSSRPIPIITKGGRPILELA